MAVYWDRRVEIPKERVVRERQANGAPALVKYVLSSHWDSRKGYPVAKRTTIGHQCADDVAYMHPTTQYVALFPEQWAALAGEKDGQPTSRCIGLRAAAAALEPACGIRGVLDEALGDQRADALLDAAGEALRRGMQDHADGEKSLDCALTDEEILLFRRKWAVQCRAHGADAVWLCADCLQGDWESPGVEISEEGQSPEGSARAPYLVYAVAPDGMPISLDLLPEGLEGGRALEGITGILRDCGVRVKGIILLRGQWETALIRSLQRKNLAYLILLKEAPQGCEEAFATFAAGGKRDAVNWIPGTYLFGTQRPVQLFGEDMPQQTLTLLFDHHIGDARITALLERLQREAEKQDQAELQREMDRAGVYDVLSSCAMPPRETAALLSGLDASEKQYGIARGEVRSGFDEMQDAAPQTIRFIVGFLAAILRYQIEQAASAAELDRAEIVQALCGMEAHGDSGAFSYIHTESEAVQAFFRSLGADAEQLLQAAVQHRNGKPAKRAPGVRKPPSNAAPEEQNAPAQAAEHQRRGVPQGTKRPAINKDGTPRKKPGVRPGTKRGALNQDGTPRKKPGPKGKKPAAQG